MKKIFLTLILVFASAFIVSGQVWYVSQSAGDDGNSGNSYNNAAATIQKALTLTSSGDTIMVIDNETYEIGFDTRLMVDTSNIGLIAAADSAPTLKAIGTWGYDSPVIDLSGKADSFTVSGLIIDCDSNAKTAIRPYTGITNLVITNNTIKNFGSYGIWPRSSNAYIAGNTINGCADGQGIKTDFGDAGDFDRITIYNNVITGIASGQAITLYRGINVIIDSNYINVGSANGIEIKFDANTDTISNNIITVAQSARCILIEMSDNCVIQGNRLTQSSSGSAVYIGDSANNTIVRNNTVYSNDWYCFEIVNSDNINIDSNLCESPGVNNGGIGIYLKDGSLNAVIENNVLENCKLNGIRFESGSHNGTAANNTIIWSGSDGIDINSSDTITAYNNDVSCTGKGINITTGKNCVIDSNTINNVASSGIFIYNKSDYTIVKNNYVKNKNWYSFELLNCTGVIIDSNTYYSVDVTGILISDTSVNTKVRYNTCEFAKQYGILVRFAATNTEIKYNILTGCGYDGIKIESSLTSNWVVERNLSFGNTYSGIAIADNGSGTVVFNTFYGNGTKGLWSNADLSNFVCKNNIFYNNGEHDISVSSAYTFNYCIASALDGGGTRGINCFDSDPVFVQVSDSANLSTFFKLADTSPAIATGDPADSDPDNSDPDLRYTSMGRYPAADVIAPPPVNLVSPSNSSDTTDSRPVFTWTAVADTVTGPSASGIAAYRVELDNNSNWTDIELSDTSVSTSLQWSSDLPAGTYNWRVLAADNAGNVSSYGGDTWTLTIQSLETGGPLWYVSQSSGSDGNSGTASSPFATIQKALHSVSAGDTIIVADNSTYSVTGSTQLQIDTPGLTIKAGAGYTPAIKASESQEAIIYANSTSNFIITGFIIDGDSKANNLIKLGGSVTAVEIENCILKNFNYTAIFVKSASNVSVENNIIYNMTAAYDGAGIYIDTSNYTRIYNNEFYSISNSGFVIRINSTSSNCSVDSNYLHDNNNTLFYLNGTDSNSITNNLLVGTPGRINIEITNNSDSNYIYNNRITAGGEWGSIFVRSGSNNTIDSNYIGASQGTERKACILVESASSSNCTVTHNILIPTGDNYGIRVNSSVAGCYIGSNNITGGTAGIIVETGSNNNIFDSNSITSCTAYGIILDSSDSCSIVRNIINNTGKSSIKAGNGSDYCNIDSNTVSKYGGEGIFAHYSDTVTIRYNNCYSGTNDGIKIDHCSNWRISRNIIHNQPGNTGIAVFSNNGTLEYTTIYNCNIAFYCWMDEDPTYTIKNCIFYGNNDDFSVENGKTLTVYYSIIGNVNANGLTRGTNCVDSDPVFIQTSDSSNLSTFLHLADTSPAIAAGDPSDSDPANPDAALRYTSMGRYPAADIIAPPAVSLAEPSNNSEIKTDEPSFSWTAVKDNATGLDASGLAYYKIEIDTDSDWSDIEFSDTATSASLQWQGSLSPGTYNWRVLAADNAGNVSSSGGDTWTFNIVENIAGKPVITGPGLSYETSGLSVNVSGTNVINETVYIYLNNTLKETDTDGNTEWSITLSSGLIINGTSTVGAVAFNGVKRSDTAYTYIFIDTAGPSVDKLNLSLSSVKDTTPYINFDDFTDSVSIIMYEILIDTNSVFTFPDTFYSSTSDTTIPEPGLDYNIYYVKIRGRDKLYNWGPYSGIDSFTILPPDIRIESPPTEADTSYTIILGNILGSDTTVQIYQNNVDTLTIEFANLNGSGTWSLHVNFPDTTGNRLVLKTTDTSLIRTSDTSFIRNINLDSNMFFDIDVFDSKEVSINNKVSNIVLSADFKALDLDADKAALFYLNPYDSVWYDVTKTWQPGGPAGKNFEVDIINDTFQVNLNHFSHYYLGEGYTDTVTVDTLTDIPAGYVFTNKEALIMSIYIAGDTNNGDTLTGIAVTNSGTADSNSIKNIKLYRDADNSLDYSNGDILEAVLLWDSDSSRWDTSNINTSLSSAGDTFVLYAELYSAADSGSTIKAEIPPVSVSTVKEETGPVNKVSNKNIQIIQTYIARKGYTWYVSKSSGSDANSGSITSPFASAQKALSEVSYGDTIFIMDTETYSITKSDSLVIDTEFVTVTAYPDTMPVFKAGEDEMDALLLSETSANYLTVSYIIFDGDSLANNLIKIKNINIEDVEIKNCVFKNFKFSGIRLSECSGGTITKNIISNLTEDWYGAGILCDTAYNVTIFNNEIYDIKKSGFNIRLDVNSARCVIDSNYIHATEQTVLNINGADSITITNNVIEGYAGKINIEITNGSDSNYIYNNRLISGGEWGSLFLRSGANNIIDSNYIGASQGDGLKACILVESSNSSNCTVTNNILLPTGDDRGIRVNADVTGSLFAGNIITGGKTGIYVESNSQNNIFRSNVISACSDKGIQFTSSDSNIIEKNIIKNTGSSAVKLENGSDYCFIDSNTVSGYGGEGIYIISSETVSIRYNECHSGKHDGIKVENSSGWSITRNLIHSQPNNTGIAINANNGSITYNTIYGCYHALWCWMDDDPTFTIKNCIFWGNADNFSVENGKTLTVTYSIIGSDGANGLERGVNCFDSDPLFVQTTDSSNLSLFLHLRNTSPAAGSGESGTNMGRWKETVNYYLVKGINLLSDPGFEKFDASWITWEKAGVTDWAKQNGSYGMAFFGWLTNENGSCSQEIEGLPNSDYEFSVYMYKEHSFKADDLTVRIEWYDTGGITLLDYVERSVLDELTVDSWTYVLIKGFSPVLTGKTKVLIKCNNYLSANDELNRYSLRIDDAKLEMLEQDTPSIQYIYPSSGQTEVEINSNIIISFNKIVDTTSVRDGFTLTDFKDTITSDSGIWEWDGETGTFNPGPLLNLDRTYHIYLDTGVKDRQLTPYYLKDVYSCTFYTKKSIFSGSPVIVIADTTGMFETYVKGIVNGDTLIIIQNNADIINVTVTDTDFSNTWTVNIDFIDTGNFIRISDNKPTAVTKKLYNIENDETSVISLDVFDGKQVEISEDQDSFNVTVSFDFRSRGNIDTNVAGIFWIGRDNTWYEVTDKEQPSGRISTTAKYSWSGYTLSIGLKHLSVLGAFIIASDSTAPSAITDLCALPGPYYGQITLGWTASGDDTSNGTADRYIIKKSLAKITVASWSSAETVDVNPEPVQAGRIQSFQLTGLVPGKRYYFAIKAVDEHGNMSGISNSDYASVSESLPRVKWLDNYNSGAKLFKRYTNRFSGQYWSWGSGAGKTLNASLESNPEITYGGTGRSLRMDYYVKDGFVMLGTNLEGADLSDYRSIILYIKGDDLADTEKDVCEIGLRNKYGQESKVKIYHYVNLPIDTGWQKVVIPFKAFSNLTSFDNMENFSITIVDDWIFESDEKGTMFLDDIKFSYNYGKLVINKFPTVYVDFTPFYGSGGVASFGNILTEISSIDPFEGNYCVKISTDTDGDNGMFVRTNYINLLDMNKLIFNIKGENGNEKLKIAVKSYRPNGEDKWEIKKDIDTYIVSNDHITTSWDTVVVPISEFLNQDISQVELISFTLYKKGTVWLDNIYCINDSPVVEPVNLQINTDKKEFYLSNELKVTGPSIYDYPFLEGVRFEYSDDKINWKTAGEIMDPMDGYNLAAPEYELFWNVYNLEDKNYFIRAAAYTSSGTYAVSTEIESINTTGVNDESVVFPNPYMPGKGSGKLTFFNFPRGVDIKIYTISAELVTTLLDTDFTGTIKWDGRNKSGQTVASGIYIYYVNLEGNRIKKGLFCVIK